jgi:hypothetical protein
MPKKLGSGKLSQIIRDCQKQSAGSHASLLISQKPTIHDWRTTRSRRTNEYADRGHPVGVLQSTPNPWILPSLVFASCVAFGLEPLDNAGGVLRPMF